MSQFDQIEQGASKALWICFAVVVVLALVIAR